MSEQMAIINEVGIGIRDAGRPILWFTVHLMEGGTALNIFDWEEAAEIIKTYGLYEVHDLTGKPCRVEVGDRRIKYSGPVKISCD
ncbi:hypothetical protein LCGC14_1417540 [marine sediment metagenome]|uniref:Uncharacterized protein n=1 Tax=marine sediment metagenome TaxID=412755 RepID=A0A0F9JSR3_9ZZZZ